MKHTWFASYVAAKGFLSLQFFFDLRIILNLSKITCSRWFCGNCFPQCLQLNNPFCDRCAFLPPTNIFSLKDKVRVAASFTVKCDRLPLGLSNVREAFRYLRGLSMEVILQNRLKMGLSTGGGYPRGGLSTTLYGTTITRNYPIQKWDSW